MRYRITAGALAVGIAALAGATAAQAQTKEMVYSSYLPPKHLMNTFGIEPMFKELAAAGIPWKLVTGGQMFSAQNTLKGVGNRTADGGGPTVTPYTRAELKHANIVADLLMFGRDSMAMSAAAVETYMLNCPECLDDYKRNGTVYLSGYGVGGYTLLCNKQVAKLADVEGKKVRTTGPLGRWAKAMGGTPVNMTSGDMVEAMARGQIDCIMGSIAWLKAYPLDDSVKSIYEYNLGSLAGIGLFIVNRKVWDGYTADQHKKILAAQAGGVARTVLAGYIGDEARARNLAKEKGIPINKAGDDIMKVWSTFKEHELELTIKNAEKIGVKEPKRIADSFLKNLAKWEDMVNKAGLPKMVDAAGTDQAKLDAATKIYQDMIQKTIYDKVDVAKL
ncbi:MAG: hypothetical protein AB7K86_20945 [Rhodospirillales bacterium]